MASPYTEKIRQWSATDNKIIAVDRLLQFLGKKLFRDHEPSHTHPEFNIRLEKWIENLSGDNQKKLLELATKIFYVGQEEFKALYEIAFNDIFYHWIIERNDFRLDDHLLPDKLNEETNFSWFCQVTDSCRINSFYTVNNIQNRQAVRSEWRTLKLMSTPEQIRDYMSGRNIRNLVLLEDFVGTGTQSSPVIQFACEVAHDINVLFIPLIICPEGVTKIRTDTSRFSNFTLRPVLTLGEHSFLKTSPTSSVESIANLQGMLIAAEEKIMGCLNGREKKKLKKFNLGGTLVMYTNTPNNSIPAIHFNNDCWDPLFIRNIRQ